MTSLLQDLRYGLRALQRSRGFTITAVLVLALVTGANTAIFSLVEAVLLRPLPYRDSQRICLLWKTVPAKSIEWDWTSYPTIRDWREQNHVFEDLAVVLRPEASRVTLKNAAGVEEIQASKVSGNFFVTLGVKPYLGRTFSRDESGAAVLSYAFWQSRFRTNQDALGRTLQLDDHALTIIGVMPPGFQFPDKTTQLWMQVTSDSRWPAFERVRVADAFCALARLKPGISIQQARAEMSAISERLARQYPATDAPLNVRVVPLFDQITGPQVQRSLWVLACAALCVLLIACSNIAGLLVARGASRRKELAVRAALGAARGRLLRQLAAENLILSLAGGAVGLFLAYAGLHALLAQLPSGLPRSDGVSMNCAVLGFTFGLCLITGLVFGLIPALQIVDKDAQAGLYQGGRGISSGLGVNRARSVLVAVQFSLAIILLTGAGLLLRSFLLLDAVKPGFDTRRLLTMTVQLPMPRYEDENRRRMFAEETARRVAALPGIRGAAVGEAVAGSFRDHVPNQNLVIEGRAITQDVERHGRQFISDDYFHVMGIALLQGRSFSSEDFASGPPVAVVNEAMVRRFWPSESPLGKRFKQVLPGMDGQWITVIGVVANVVYNRDGIVAPFFYRSTRQWTPPELPLLVRTDADPAPLMNAIRQAVRSVDPSVPYFEIATAAQRRAELDRPRRFETTLIASFAATAILLAALGLYGLIRYSVEQRHKEIGIRIALGASSRDIAHLILRQGLQWSGIGIIVGIAGALAFARTLASSLFGITATDPATLATVVSTLVIVAIAASSFPARQATQVDPSAALRD